MGAIGSYLKRGSTLLKHSPEHSALRRPYRGLPDFHGLFRRAPHLFEMGLHGLQLHVRRAGGGNNANSELKLFFFNGTRPLFSYPHPTDLSGVGG